jgi:peptidoglycan hydrolase-like protein with peptidoglycan-binding domain
MHRHVQRTAMLGMVLLVASLLFAFAPAAATAFAATKGNRTVVHASVSRPAVPAASALNPCPPDQSQGNSNTWVKVIQFRLNELDNAGLSTDGIFGTNTKNAVVAFQNAVGISGGGGVVGSRTWSAMGFCTGFSTIILGFSHTTSLTNCPASQSEGNSGILVQAIQALLNIDFDFNVFPDSPQNFHPFLAFDGVFGADTKAAVVDFQDAVGISSGGGVVGQRTWSELGMCF